MDRRGFLAAGASLAGLGGAIVRSLAGPVRGGAIVWEAEGERRVESLLEAVGGVAALLPGDPARATVLVKPNLCLPSPDAAGTTTSTALLRSLCRALVAGGVRRIIVVDHTLGATEDFRSAPHRDAVAGLPEVTFLLANEERWYTPVEVPGVALKRTSLLRVLPRADLVINLPTAKHHTATRVSLGVKNLMGLVWNRSEFHTDLDLHQAIGDLAAAVRPHLTIVDAGRVLLNGGPTGPGPVAREDRLFASRDVVAVDAVVASRYNFGGRSVVPADVPHLAAAHRNGVGEIDPSLIRVLKI